MDNTLQQPDFFDAARGLRAAADNLELCQNIPGVKDGQRYIQTLERLMTHLNEIQEEQRRGFSRSQSALESLQRDLQREIGAKYESLQREIGAKYESLQREIGAKYESLQRENSAKYESLLREIGIRDRNRLIAMENSVIVDRNSQMEPLYSLTTGQIVVDFPSCVAEGNRLTTPEANRILKELALDVNGDIRAKRRRLLIACGVRHMAL